MGWVSRLWWVRTLAAIALCALSWGLIEGQEAGSASRSADANEEASASGSAAGQSRRGPTQPAEPGLREALREGTLNIALRYRFELVDQEGFDATGRASTLRTVLGYRTGTWKGFAVKLEAENVSDVGGSRLHDNAGFGDRDNGVTGRPVIADSSGTDMVQAYLEYANESSRLRVGRQELLIGDQRFVGPVGWRQHHQTFRAISLHDESVRGLTIDYAYVDRVYTISGQRVNGDHHLITAASDLGGSGSLTGYAYLLRFDGGGRRRFSTNTFGAELAGERTVGEVPVRYEAEFAHQRAAGDNPRRVNADYLHLMLGIDYRGVALSAGLEQLDGSAEDGQFNTPLATVHLFNGWADTFTVTPTDGLRDLYLRAAGRLGGLDWTATYHRFNAKSGGDSLGSEIDGRVSYRTPWEQELALKVAIYSAGQASTDTTKLWFYTTYAF